MSVQMEISPVFKKYADNNTNFEVEGNTLGECLHDMARRFPKTKKVFMDDEGNLLRRYDIFLNGEGVYPVTMDLPVKDGDKLILLMIIHGG